MNKLYGLLAFVLVIVASPAQACVQSITSNSEYVQICLSADLCKTIFLNELQEKGTAKQAEELRQTFQDFMDFREPLTELVTDEEIRGVNPGCENFYWSDADGKVTLDSQATHYVARACVITSVTWLSDLKLFTFSIRQAQSC